MKIMLERPVRSAARSSVSKRGSCPSPVFPMSVLFEFIRESTDEKQVIWKS